MQTASSEEPNKGIIWLFFLSAYTVIFPLVLGWLGWKKQERGMRVFFILLCLVVISETTAFLTSYTESNLLVYDIFTAVEYAFLMLMFGSWYEENTFRRGMMWSVPVFIAIWITAKFILKETGEFDSVFLSIESVVFVFLSVLTLAKEMRDSNVLLVDNPRFWVSSGVLVYFAGNLFLFALIEQVLQPSMQRYHGAWLIHTALNVTKNILFALGFLSTGGPKDGWRALRRRMKWKRA